MAVNSRSLPIAGDDNSPDGFGEFGPDGIRKTFGIEVWLMTSVGVTPSARIETSPTRLETRKISCRRGLCKSPSIITTRLPSWARTTARFNAVEVFPSAGTDEAMAIVFTPPARDNNNAVRNARYASA